MKYVIVDPASFEYRFGYPHTAWSSNLKPDDGYTKDELHDARNRSRAWRGTFVSPVDMAMDDWRIHRALRQIR